MAQAKGKKNKAKAKALGYSNATLIRMAQIGATQVMREFHGQMGEIQAFLKAHPVDIVGAESAAEVQVQTKKASGPSAAQKAKAAAGLALYQATVKLAGGKAAYKALSDEEKAALKAKAQEQLANPAKSEASSATPQEAEGLAPEVAAALAEA